MGDSITYSVQPDSVDYSGGADALSVVTLTVTAINDTSTDVVCSSLGISVGTIGFGQSSLTEDPSTIAVAPGPTTPWAIGPGGTSTWTALPLPPVTSLPANSAVSFALADVVVNQTPGTAQLVITEVTDQTRTISLSVTKANRAPPGSTPIIGSFTATPTEVAQNGTVTLNWQVADATSCVLGPSATTVGPNGPLQVLVPATTTYTLNAYGTGGSASAKVIVVVGPVKIISFTADPAGPVPAGTAVTLSWVTSDAAACSIDTGVGPVPTSGQVTVKPSQTTIYTLSALGLQPQAAAVTVAVTS